MGLFNKKNSEVKTPRFTKEQLDKILAEINELDSAVQATKLTRDTEIAGVAHSVKVPSDRRLSIEVLVDKSGYDWFSSYTETFSTEVLRHIKDSGISNKEFYSKAHMDRKLFSTMKNNKDYQPKKSTAVACCLALELSLRDTNELLSKAGDSLSKSIKWDRVIYYCISKGIYDIFDVNEILYAAGEKCL